MSQAPAAKSTIAFIGLGIMGRHMAGHLLAAGYRLKVFTRTRDKAEALLARGAVWCDTPAASVVDADLAITIVGNPKDVEEVYLGKNGLVAAAKPGAILIDMTTSSPSLAVRIAEAASARGLKALDAPVTGGEGGARDAKLSIMVGGDKAAFETALPALQCLGTNIVRMGDPGSGQTAKLCNQILVAGVMLGIAEGLGFAKQAGLDTTALYNAIKNGAAGSFQLNIAGPKMMADDFTPGFMIEHFLKDLTIAAEETKRIGLDTPGIAAAKEQYQKLYDRGHGRDGTQALYRLYRGAV